MPFSQQLANYVVTYDARQITTQQLTMFKMAFLNRLAVSYADFQQLSNTINGLRH